MAVVGCGVLHRVLAACNDELAVVFVALAMALANGVTLEQMMSNPEAAAKAYLDSQLKEIEKAGAELVKSVTA